MIHHPLGERLDHILCFGLPMVALVQDVDHSEATCSVSPKNALVLQRQGARTRKRPCPASQTLRDTRELESERGSPEVRRNSEAGPSQACWRLQGWFGSFLAFRTSQRPSPIQLPTSVSLLLPTAFEGC